ncbi:MAG: potassium/proton antiporter, partial [Tidjanibacter sp.]|nr:potassium/proton antiporter [Tidjanibacter sp.]
GAAPILFATYPKLAGIDPNNTIFNIVFFITIISLLVQGTTVSSMAEVLGVSAASPEEGFDIDLPEDIKASLTEVEVNEDNTEGKTLREISLPEKTLIMMIRREGHYIIPNGNTVLQKGDRLLLISEEAQQHTPEIKRSGKFALLRRFIK